MSAEEHIEKKAKLEKAQETAAEKSLFQPVGELAAETDVGVDGNVGGEDEQGLRKTGAEDAQGRPVQEVDSLCMGCGETGVTRLLLTTIPYFKEIVLMSFSCPHCGLKNNEVQPASEIQEKGCKYLLKIENASDFQRQIVKSNSATCTFAELDLEIPPKAGQLTSPEGLLNEMIEYLQAYQPERKQADPETYEKIETFIAKVKSFLNCEPDTVPLTLTLNDPSGNSWIEYSPGEPQHKWSCSWYPRTPAQNVQLGLVSEDEVAYREQQIQKQKEEAAKQLINSHDQQDKSHETNKNPKVVGLVSDKTEIENINNEVEIFSATCSGCYAPCETRMKLVNIPHFKEVVIMSTTCDRCGYKSNEVKTGGAIPDHGTKISLFCEDPEDLARDILKSETCEMKIPELNLDLTPGTLGGRFTTIEGLLRQVREELHSRVYTQTSDSMAPDVKARWNVFFDNLDRAVDGQIKFTIHMIDPLSSSYIQNVYAPDADPNMTIIAYPRTEEENEELGLTDMKTENYSQNA